MDILVTGGSGFLGSHLVAALRHGGHGVEWTFCRRPEPSGDGGAFRLDLASPSIDEAMAGRTYDAVVHCAGWTSVGACAEDPEGADRVNVRGTGLLAAFARRSGARFIHLSTDVVFDGEGPPYDEESPVAPLHHYGHTKAAAEDRVREALADAVVVRPSLIYRRRGEGRVEPAAEWVVRKARAGEAVRLFSNQMRNPVAVGDLSRVLVRLVEDGTFKGVLHVGGGDAVSRLDFGRLLLRHHGLPVDGVEAVVYRHGSFPMRYPIDLTLALGRLERLMGAGLPGVRHVLREVRGQP